MRVTASKPEFPVEVDDMLCILRIGAQDANGLPALDFSPGRNEHGCEMLIVRGEGFSVIEYDLKASNGGYDAPDDAFSTCEGELVR